MQRARTAALQVHDAQARAAATQSSIEEPREALRIEQEKQLGARRGVRRGYGSSAAGLKGFIARIGKTCSKRLVRVLDHALVAPYWGYAYRIVAEKWRDAPLSATGSVRCRQRSHRPIGNLVSDQ